jgi:ribokinase
MTKIAVIGSLLVDISVPTPHLPEWGKNIQVDSYSMGAGGKGANAATTIARMEGEALIIGCVGDDRLGRLEIATLRAEGIDTSGVIQVPGRATDIAMLMVNKDGENAALAITTTNHLLTGQMIESALESHWGSLDAVLVNFECSDEAVATAIWLARVHDIPAIVDAGPIRDFRPEIWREATVLSPNINEMAALAMVPPRTLTEEEVVHRLARDLLMAGPEAIVVKWGARGTLLVTIECESLVPAFSVNVVDTTGAGDAFTAALTLALAKGEPLLEAVRFANAAGAMAASQFGTLEAMPTLAAVNQLLMS